MFTHRSLFAFSLVLVLAPVFVVRASDTQAEPPANPHAVATFECLGLYYTVDTDTPGECTVEYRPAGKGDWREGLPLDFDRRDRQFRGSLIGLTPDTEYDVRLHQGGKTVELSARTRSDRFPVGKTTHLKPGWSDATLTISESGSADGYHLVTVTPGSRAIIDVNNARPNCVVIDASHVIVRGLELLNAEQSAVVIAEGKHDIVIEDCHIRNWGRRGTQDLNVVGFGPKKPASFNTDAGISVRKNTARLTLQRNLIDYPRGGSNDWTRGHPLGPIGININSSLGGNVIRYNEIIASEDQGFLDGIAGGEDFSFQGNMNRDADIYGNIVAHTWDDSIESEGANMNVRIWGNYLHHTYVHIATCVTSKGPLYIFRNVFGVSRLAHTNPIGGNVIKVGDPEPFRGGRRYVLHNTILQPHGALNLFNGRPVYVTTRNNILDLWGETVRPEDRKDRTNRLGPDLRVRDREALRFAAMQYTAPEREEFFLAPMVVRVPSGDAVFDRNPGIDTGVRLPGFNDDFKGKGPDMGAFEQGNPPVRFGRRAMPGAKPAPWEEL